MTYLKLCPGCLSIAKCVDNLAFCPRQLGSTLKVLERLCDLSLLQQQLCHGGNSNVALWIDDERLLAQLLGIVEVVLPLEQRKGLVDEGQDVHSEGLARLLHLDSSVKLLDSLLVLLLIEKQFSVVVVNVGYL